MGNDEVGRLCRFSVAWYPAYRIPDAPLNGRFLTFHRLTPQHRSSSNQAGAPDTYTEASHTLDVPVAGLKLCNLHGERWLEPLSLETVADHKMSQHGTQLRNSNAPHPKSSVPQALQLRLNGLQQSAEHLARGQGLRLLRPWGLERLQQRHPDFEFFHTRH